MGTPEEDVMAIVQFTRFKSDKSEEMVKTAKQAKAIFEKHGAEFLRLSRFHTGMWAGEWLVSTRYSSWKCMERCRRQWQRTCCHHSVFGCTSRSFLGASARSITRSASATTSDLLAVRPPTETPVSSETDHFHTCRPMP